MNKQDQAKYTETSTEGISLVELIKRLWRGKWIIVIALIVCLSAGMVYSFLIKKDSYISQAALSCEPREYPEFNINTYVDQMSNDEFIEVVTANINEAGYDLTAEQLKASVSITGNENMNILYISVEMPDPQMSADIANTFIDEFPAYITTIVKDKCTADIEYLEDCLAESRLELDEKFGELTEYMNEYEGIGNIQNEIEALREQQVDLLVLENNTRTNIETYSLQLAYLIRIAELKGIEIVTYVPIDESAKPSITGAGTINGNNTISESVLIDQINEIQNDIVEEQSRIIAVNNSISVIDEQLSEKESYYNEHGCKYDMMAREYNNKKEMCISYLSQIADIQKVSYSQFGEENIEVETRATVPQIPVETNKLRTVTISGIAGLLLGGVIALFSAYWKKEKEKQKE